MAFVPDKPGTYWLIADYMAARAKLLAKPTLANFANFGSHYTNIATQLDNIRFGETADKSLLDTILEWLPGPDTSAFEAARKEARIASASIQAVLLAQLREHSQEADSYLFPEEKREPFLKDCLKIVQAADALKEGSLTLRRAADLFYGEVKERTEVLIKTGTFGMGFAVIILIAAFLFMRKG